MYIFINIPAKAEISMRYISLNFVRNKIKTDARKRIIVGRSINASFESIKAVDIIAPSAAAFAPFINDWR